MSTRSPLIRLATKPLHPPTLPLTQTRHESTTRRHRKLLFLPGAPSYTPSTATPTLIFNPPSSAPNIYHTPSKFLPATDKRRLLYASALTRSTATALRTASPSTASPGTPLTTPSHPPPKPSAPLPDPVRAPYEKKYHVSAADVEEMRRLRAANPRVWTRVRLAERFGCSQFFVGMVAKNEGVAEKRRMEDEKVRVGWGRRRREAREDRGRRREGWGRDA
ncbi:mitochondrial ribosomal protein subunit L20-domain-containing protein [Massariosphaeria phaeospora]|uniref:Mitochondrial ribosomal protein subunit L20-domain-containing protein n=1 Tax=Massariosphaeria phaeospora TaxID=100035 RepID=A0A7C8MUY3_9PLEO|nr:mitochondrial ribosomal protein subunit L20-domain-containing protein [Massariosphaeria phaeospora]